MNTKFIPLAVLAALLISSCIPATPAETTVKITQPLKGEKVNQTQSVIGESQLIPDGSVIWMIVFLPVTGRYYPQNSYADVQANGNWASTVFIGQTGDSGLAADIIAVVANKSAQDAFNAYLVNAKNKNDYPGLEKIPEGATIYDRISVERK